jgi:hypothetical protein
LTTEADYSPQEWASLRRAVLVAGLAVSLADPGGPVELTREVIESQRAIANPPGDHELLREVSEDAMMHAKEVRNLRDDLGLEAGTVFDQIANELRRIDAILRAKATPEEAAAFRGWMMGAAEDTAEASTDGRPSAVGAVHVSRREEIVLAQLRDILGLPAA